MFLTKMVTEQRVQIRQYELSMQNFENCLVPAQAITKMKQESEGDAKALKAFKSVQSFNISQSNLHNYERPY